VVRSYLLHTIPLSDTYSRRYSLAVVPEAPEVPDSWLVNDLLVLLGKRIHELRAAKKWSQEEFAHVSGFHRTYVGQIERGEKNMSFDNLAKVADALGVTMATLLDGLENGSRRDPEIAPG